MYRGKQWRRLNFSAKGCLRSVGYGVMPMWFSLDVVGPLACRARDCARLRSIIAERIAPTPLHGFTVEDVAMPIENLREIAELHPLVMRAEGAANHMNDMRAIRRIYTRSEKSSAGQISHSGDCIHPGAEAHRYEQEARWYETMPPLSHAT
jgi:hypothetical protein